MFDCILFILIILYNTTGMSHLKGDGFVDFRVYLLRDERMEKKLWQFTTQCPGSSWHTEDNSPSQEVRTAPARALFAIGFYFLDAPRTCMGRTVTEVVSQVKYCLLASPPTVHVQRDVCPYTVQVRLFAGYRSQAMRLSMFYVKSLVPWGRFLCK